MGGTHKKKRNAVCQHGRFKIKRKEKKRKTFPLLLGLDLNSGNYDRLVIHVAWVTFTYLLSTAVFFIYFPYRRKFLHLIHVETRTSKMERRDSERRNPTIDSPRGAAASFQFWSHKNKYNHREKKKGWPQKRKRIFQVLVLFTRQNSFFPSLF